MKLRPNVLVKRYLILETDFQRRCVRPECPNLVPLDRLKKKGITCSVVCQRLDRLGYMRLKRILRRQQILAIGWVKKSKSAKSEQMHTVRGLSESADQPVNVISSEVSPALAVATTETGK